MGRASLTRKSGKPANPLLDGEAAEAAATSLKHGTRCDVVKKQGGEIWGRCSGGAGPYSCRPLRRPEAHHLGYQAIEQSRQAAAQRSANARRAALRDNTVRASSFARCAIARLRRSSRRREASWSSSVVRSTVTTFFPSTSWLCQHSVQNGSKRIGTLPSRPIRRYRSQDVVLPSTSSR